jgi:5-methylcytosine-specific restriction endonuclease McrA
MFLFLILIFVIYYLDQQYGDYWFYLFKRVPTIISILSLLYGVYTNGLKNYKKREVKRYVSVKNKKTVASNQKWNCNICKNMLDETYEIDHIMPLYKGGTNDIINLQALCPNCHRKKTIMDMI